MNARNWYLWGGGLILGAIAGYAYWNYIGCLSGTCAITSSPVNSTLYGGLMGILTANLFTSSKRNHQEEK